MRRMEEICKQHLIPHKNTLQTLTVLTEKQKLETTLREEVAAKDHQIVELMARMEVMDHELKTKVNQPAVLVDVYYTVHIIMYCCHCHNAITNLKPQCNNHVVIAL